MVPGPISCRCDPLPDGQYRRPRHEQRIAPWPISRCDCPPSRAGEIGALPAGTGRDRLRRTVTGCCHLGSHTVRVSPSSLPDGGRAGFAFVAQLEEAPDLGSGGWGFESLRRYNRSACDTASVSGLDLASARLWEVSRSVKPALRLARFDS